MEGRIVGVLETWPLQLLVEGTQGRWSVALGAETVIRQAGRTIDPGGLRPGSRVVVRGEVTGALAMGADSIDLVP